MITFDAAFVANLVTALAFGYGRYVVCEDQLVVLHTNPAHLPSVKAFRTFR